MLCRSSAAQAAALSIVEVGAPAVNCAFNNAGSPNCTVVVDDSVGTFTPPGDMEPRGCSRAPIPERRRHLGMTLNCWVD
jgi:hypothetical protein